MVKIQPCNKGCKKLITVQFDQKIGKYAPYEVDTSGEPTNLHNCPNSEYNKSQQQGQQQQQQQSSPSSSTILSSSSSSQLQQIDPRFIQIVADHYDKLSKKMDEVKELVERCTIMDTNKFIGTMQTFHDDVLPFIKSNFKVASEIEQDKARLEKRQQEQREMKNWDIKTDFAEQHNREMREIEAAGGGEGGE